MKPTSLTSLKNLANLKRKIDTNYLCAKRYEELAIDAVYSVEQPRRVFEKLDELAQSLKELGQQTPIVVNPDGKGRYVIEQGERRWRAAKMAGLTTIAAVISHSERDLKRTVRQLAENVQRDDMKLMELAQAVHELVTAGLGIRELAGLLGKKESYISTLNACAEVPPVLTPLVKGNHIKDPVSLRRLKNACADNESDVARQIADWQSAAEKGDDFTVTRVQVSDFIRSLQSPSVPAVPTANEPPADTSVPDPAFNSDASSEHGIVAPRSAGASSAPRLHPDEVLADIPDGYSRCPSTDYRVFVRVKKLGEGCLTPNVIPPTGRLSVILTKSGKMTEVDARDVTILRIGSRKRGD